MSKWVLEFRVWLYFQIKDFVQDKDFNLLTLTYMSLISRHWAEEQQFSWVIAPWWIFITFIWPSSSLLLPAPSSRSERHLHFVSFDTWSVSQSLDVAIFVVLHLNAHLVINEQFSTLAAVFHVTNERLGKIVTQFFLSNLKSIWNVCLEPN